jgi:hypothetical protein
LGIELQGQYAGGAAYGDPSVIEQLDCPEGERDLDYAVDLLIEGPYRERSGAAGGDRDVLADELADGDGA